MAEHVEIEGKKYKVVSRDIHGTPIIKGHATSVHHTDADGNLLYDKNGNPVRSVHVSVSPIESMKEEG